MPKKLELTSQSLGAKALKCTPEASEAAAFVKDWDEEYQKRVANWPTFLVCAADYLNISSPPQVRREQMLAIFGHIPGTQAGKLITCEQLTALSHIRGAAA